MPRNGLLSTLLNGNGLDTSNSGMPAPTSSDAGSNQNPYRGPVLVLTASAFLGTAGALVAGLLLANPVHEPPARIRSALTRS